jgi:hypothetical protein
MHPFLDGMTPGFFVNAFFLQKLIERRSNMAVFHFSSSFWRFRASASSLSGVCCVFLMKACSAISVLPCTQAYGMPVWLF